MEAKFDIENMREKIYTYQDRNELSNVLKFQFKRQI